MNIGERIKNKRLELNLTQKELGEMVGLTQPSLQNIESGKTVRPRNIDGLAMALKCTPEFLQFGSTLVESSNVSYMHTFKNNLPLVSWVQAGNWSSIETLPSSEVEYYLCPINCSAKAFVLKVQGESMQPRFNEGDHIFVDPEVQPDNGSYVVALLEDENEATFKQLVIDGNKKYLKAINPDWPTKFIEINGNCIIVGKIIYKGEKY